MSQLKSLLSSFVLTPLARWGGPLFFCAALLGGGACTEGPERNEPPAEISTKSPAGSASASELPAPLPASSAGSPQSEDSGPAAASPSASCPVIAQRQTRHYYTESDAAYAALLAGRTASTICFPNETVARESGYRSPKTGSKKDRDSGAQIGAGRLDLASLRPDSKALTLRCTAGRSVRGEIDRWSPLSKCPEGYQVTGLQRLDLLGDHNVPITHVNDISCSDEGCKAWCIGAPCTLEARCCRVSVDENI